STPLGEGKYEIAVRVNQYTSTPQAYEYFSKRAIELCGGPYDVLSIVGPDGGPRAYAYASSGSRSGPTSTAEGAGLLAGVLLRQAYTYGKADTRVIGQVTCRSEQSGALQAGVLSEGFDQLVAGMSRAEISEAMSTFQTYAPGLLEKPYRD